MSERLRAGRNMEYLGGFFDVASRFEIIYESPDGQDCTNPLPNFIPRIIVDDSRPGVVSWLKQIYPLKETPRKKGTFREDPNSWNFSNPRECWDFLISITPHLRIKQKQAKAFMDFLEERIDYRTKYDLNPALRSDLRSVKKEAALVRIFEAEKVRPYTAHLQLTPDRTAGILDRTGKMMIKHSTGGGFENYWTLVGLKSQHTGLITGFKNEYPKPSGKVSTDPNNWEVTGEVAGRVLEDINNLVIFRRQVVGSLLDFQNFLKQERQEYLERLRQKGAVGSADPNLERRLAEKKRLYDAWIRAKLASGERVRRKVA